MVKKNTLFLNCMEKNIKVFHNNNNLTVHIYSKSRVFILGIGLNVSCSWDVGSKHFVLVHNQLNPNIDFLQRFMFEMLYVFNRFWYTKISFKGKGFKIKKRRRTKSIKFFFYHSHVNTIIFKEAKLKQKKKNKFLIKTWNFWNLKKTMEKVINIRGLNVFTKRGLRVNRQVVYKKTGKKSNY